MAGQSGGNDLAAGKLIKSGAHVAFVPKSAPMCDNRIFLGTAAYADIELGEFVRDVCAKVTRRHRGYCCVSNVHSMVLANRDAKMSEAYASADMVYPDSRVLTALLSLISLRKPPPVLRGDRLLAQILGELGNSARVALYGGRTPGQLDALSRGLQKQYGINCVFAECPPFSDAITSRDDGLLRRINESGANFVVLGLGCPKQELWMANNSDQLNAYCIGVGAAFDYITGEQTDSPRWVHAIGLEWLWRLVSDPTRIWQRHRESFLPLLSLVSQQCLANARSGTRSWLRR